MSSRTSVSLDRVENGENRPSFTEGFYCREAKKEAVFEREKLGVSVVMGSTAGHVPVLDSSVTADNGCLLDIGDQIIQVIVGAKVTCLIDEDDPFEKLLSLMKGTTTRPITFVLMTQSCPAPYAVRFPKPTLGIQLGENSDKGDFPFVAQCSAAEWPCVEDALVAIDGSPLASLTDKYGEAIQLIRDVERRPLRLLFQPRIDHSHKVVVFRAEKLGISLSPGASPGHLPVCLL